MLSPRLGVVWYSECGCTGFQIEATTLLAPFSDPEAHVPDHVTFEDWPEVSLTKCQDTCPGWAPQAERALRHNLTIHLDHRRSRTVFVSHIAYLGVCGLPPELEGIAARRSMEHVGEGNERLVARVMTEVSTPLPPDAVLRCESFDQIWVPSEWHRDLFSSSGVERGRLKVLTEAVDVHFWLPGRGDKSCNSALLRAFRASRKEKRFIFLSVFKWEERKNWPLLVQSFLEEFGGAEEIGLWIKTSPYMNSQPWAELRYFSAVGLNRLQQAESQILLSDERLSAEELRCLYSLADAFVLPSRGEGFGLPMAEAMSSGLIVMGPNFGGSQEMVAAAGVLLNGTVIDGSFEVSRESLRHEMRAATEGKFLGLGDTARDYVMAHHSPEVVTKSLATLAAASFPQLTPKQDILELTMQTEDSAIRISGLLLLVALSLALGGFLLFSWRRKKHA